MAITKEQLEKYAQVLVNFALNNGKGIKKGEIVHLEIQYPAMPLAVEVYRQILKSGGHVMTRVSHEDLTRVLYEDANDEQLQFFPTNYAKALVDTIDHRIALLAENNPTLLADIDPKKIILSNSHRKEYREWLNAKEDAGKLSWTLANYPTEAQAAQAGLAFDDYWQQIVQACFLDDDEPVKSWQNVFTQLNETLTWLNNLPIKRLHVLAPETDLWINFGEGRKWIGGSGNNIPSFEIFTSPDWRGAEGKVYFDLPLFRYGNILKDIRLEFKDGKVVKASASQNEELLLEMIKQENADKIGEFSLTDKKFSRINKFMADTLYDENFGGEFGNMHIALGTSYHDTYTGDVKNTKESDWEKLGFNESNEHCDIISTNKREVYAELADGTEKLIYKDGEFQR